MNERSPAFFIIRFWPILLFIAYFIIFLNTEKLGVSPDSVIYYSMALSFIKNGSFLNYQGDLNTIFPIGYPLFLSPFLYSLGAGLGSKISNIICLSLLIILWQKLVKYILKNRNILYSVFFCLLAGSMAFYNIYLMVWSEVLALTLLIAFIYLDFFSDNNTGVKKGKFIFVSGLIASLLCLTRYSFILVWFSSIILNLLFTRTSKMPAKYLYFAGYFIFPFTLILTRWGRNDWPLFGSRDFLQPTNLLDIISQLGKSIVRFFIPLPLNQISDDIGVIVSALMAFVILISLYNAYAYKNSSLIKASTYCTSYIITCLLSMRYSRIDEFGDRLTSPIYIFLLLCTAMILKNIKLDSNNLFRKSLPSLCLLFVVFNVAGSAPRFLSFYSNGLGYSSLNIMEKNQTIYDNEIPHYSNYPAKFFLKMGLPVRPIGEIDRYYSQKWQEKRLHDDLSRYSKIYLSCFYENDTTVTLETSSLESISCSSK